VHGFLITIGALSLCATFWFHLLGKIANLRNSRPKPARTVAGAPVGARRCPFGTGFGFPRAVRARHIALCAINE
jgi:hypothetical protein